MSTTAACSSCSQPLPDDGAFCAHCGNQVGDAEKTVLAVRRIREGTSTGQAQCQSCNSLLGVRDVFCRFCGARDRDMARSDAPAEEPGPDLMKERLAEATGDEFEIIKRLGKGGMGSVYLARESALQRFVAIKVLAPEFLADETLLERFRTEARIVATLRHRSIVGIHAVRHSEDLHYFVMDYVEGASLGDVIKSHGPLPVTVVKAVLYEVGSALTYAHQQGGGIIHRDIKPGNIMLDSTGAIVVMDYGISKAVGTKAGLTMDGSIIGTPEYMSPEQCRGNVLTVASDQYALGLLGYAMLSGAPPFSGPQWVVITAQIQETPPHITEIRRDCPEDLADSIHRMLEKAPAERWPAIPDALKAFGGTHHDLGDPVREETGRLALESEGATTVEIPVSRLELATPPENVEPGDELVLDAELFDDLGRVLSGRQISWSTSDPNIIAVSSDGGTGLARAPGTVSITASVGTVGSSQEFTVREPTPASIAVDPDAIELHPGERAVLIAVVKDRRANPMRGDAQWSTSDESVVSVSEGGQVQGRNPGSAVITAEIVGLEANAEITVEPSPLMAIDLSQLPELILPGDEFRLEAVRMGGGESTEVDVVWRSSDESVATVDAGLVRARSAGMVTVTAARREVEGSALIIIVEREVTEVVLEGPRNRIEIDDELPLGAEARDQRGEGLEREMSWSSSDTSVATVGPDGIVQAVSGGAAEISASADGVSGVMSLTVAPKSVHIIELSTPAESLLERQSLDLEVVVRDSAGQPLQGHDIEWEVSDDAVATIDGSGVLTGIAPGALTVTAICGGRTASIAIRVSGIPVAAIHIAAVPEEVRVGDHFELQATAEDADADELQRRFKWSSSDPALASVAPTGAVTVKSVGEVEITASVDGVDATVSLTITEALAAAASGGIPRWLMVLGGLALPVLGVVAWQQLSGTNEGSATDPAGVEAEGPPANPVGIEGAASVASVAVVPPSGAVLAGDTVRLSATALDGDGASVSASTVVWRVDDSGVATVDQDGVLIAGLAGSVRVSAVVDGVEGSIDLVVGPRSGPGTGDAVVEQPTTAAVDDTPGAEVEESRPIPTAATETDPAPVQPAAIASVSLTVSDTNMLEGSSQSYQVELFDAGGARLSQSGRTIAVRSSSGSLVVESASGRISARVPGSAYLIATAGGVSDSVQVVVGPLVATVVIQGASARLIVDASVALQAEVRDSRQQVLSDRTVDWSSSDADVLTVDQTGRVSARSAGSADVIASSEGVQGRVTIVVEAAPPAALEPPTTAEVSAEADRYVALLNANAEDELRALFGADAEAEGSRDLLGRLDARDFAASIVSVGDVTLDGDEATVRFSVLVTYRSNFGTAREGTGDIIAVLTRTSDGWRLRSCSVAPGAEF